MTKATRIRVVILSIAIALALAIYVQYQLVAQNTNTLVTTNALTAFSFLYLALLVTPLVTLFPTIPFKPELIASRRALGVATAMFATVHGYYAFFILLGGFPGLKFLDKQYLVGITLSATALLILLILAATSFDWAIRKLGTRWKVIHRFVYLAGILIIIHALILGTHFTDPKSIVYRSFFVLVMFLFGLEAIRLDKYLNQKLNIQVRAGVVLLMFVSLVTIFFVSLEGGVHDGSLSIHGEHIAVAEQAQITPVPGTQADPTRRYSVSFSHSDSLQSNQPVTLSFHITNAATGETVNQFVKFYDKFVHLLITDENLTYFSHAHPTFDGTKFVIDQSFPHEGRYHLYLDFQPFGGIEQTFAEQVLVGANPGSLDPHVLTETSGTYTENGYTFTLKPGPYIAAQMSIGNQLLSFTASKDGQPVTTLDPYLGAYGHLTLVNTDTYEFIHVHPKINVSIPPVPSGPTIDFLPLGLTGPIKPGVYHAFAEFNPDNIYTVVPFTITIQ